VTIMTFRSIHRLAFAAALAFATLGLGNIAAAQTAPSPSAIAAAKELISLKRGEAMFDPLIPGVIESVKNTFLPTNPQLGQPLNDVAAQLRKEFDPKRVEILNEIAKIYAEHFSEQELRDIIAFYKTPSGKKMLSEEPQAIDQSLKAAQSWANQFSDVVMERFRVEMKKKGYNL
jgi:uncharacterized protein